MNKVRKKAQLPKKERGLNKRRRRPTLPLMCSTIGAVRLNFSVRNGKRWNPYAIITLNKFSQAEHPYSVLRRGFSTLFPLSVLDTPTALRSRDGWRLIMPALLLEYLKYQL